MDGEGRAEFRTPAAYGWPASLEVRERDEGTPVIGGYAVLYNERSVDLGGFVEEIAPGAFGASLSGDVRALWQHHSASVLGRTRSGTLRVWDDERGVAFELEPPDTQVGRDAVTSIKRGDVDQMSFGFFVEYDHTGKRGDMWTELEDGTYLRRVVRAELVEISPVTWAAYPQTEVSVRDDGIYGVLPEIPAEVRAHEAGDRDDAGEATRARAANRRRLLNLAAEEI